MTDYDAYKTIKIELKTNVKLQLSLRIFKFVALFI